MAIHETATEVRRVERLHSAAVDKEAALRDQLGEARKARDKAIIASTNPIAAQVAKQFGVSDAWVKRLRKKQAENQP